MKLSCCRQNFSQFLLSSVSSFLYSSGSWRKEKSLWCDIDFFQEALLQLLLVSKYVSQDHATCRGFDIYDFFKHLLSVQEHFEFAHMRVSPFPKIRFIFVGWYYWIESANKGVRGVRLLKLQGNPVKYPTRLVQNPQSPGSGVLLKFNSARSGLYSFSAAIGPVAVLGR